MNLAISPCPNDTFVYESFVRGLEAEGGTTTFLDIAELNALANHPDGPDLIKISCAAAPRFLDRYRLLPVGGAFSEAVGPLVVRSSTSPRNLPVAGSIVGIPGHGTSGHILWRHWLRSMGLPVPQERFLRFDLLPSACASGEVDFAVVIHESRFTFREAGLSEVQDLGRHWDSNHHLPVPLGCLVCRRDRGEAFAKESVERIRESLRSAWSRPEPTTEWIGRFAQEMSPEVQRLHIATYVTSRTMDCGEEGLGAMDLLWRLSQSELGPSGVSTTLLQESLDEARSLLQ